MEETAQRVHLKSYVIGAKIQIKLKGVSFAACVFCNFQFHANNQHLLNMTYEKPSGCLPNTHISLPTGLCYLSHHSSNPGLWKHHYIFLQGFKVTGAVLQFEFTQYLLSSSDEYREKEKRIYMLQL